MARRPAALAFFYAWRIGWDDISVYDGGWLQWSSDPGNPVVVRDATPQHAAHGAARSLG